MRQAVVILIGVNIKAASPMERQPVTELYYHKGGCFSMDRQSISAIIQHVVEATSPIPPSIVTREARRAVERRLYALPQLCEKLERVIDPAITQEIDSIRQALQTISRDPYYQLIPAKYFQGVEDWTAAVLCACDKVTVWRNRNRLLDVLALCLFGVSAWERTRNW